MPKYGDIHPETGMIFIQRGPTYPNGEYWVTPERFRQRRVSISNRIRNKKKTDPEFDKALKNAQKERGKSPHVKARRLAAHKRSMKNDPLYALKFLARMRLARLKKAKIVNRSSSSRKMMGADPRVCKKFIEDQFHDGMNWNNRGEWHIDHFFPLSIAKDNNAAIMLSHFTNLRPLWASENVRKYCTPPTPSEMIERDQFVENWIRMNTQNMQQS